MEPIHNTVILREKSTRSKRGATTSMLIEPSQPALSNYRSEEQKSKINYNRNSIRTMG